MPVERVRQEVGTIVERLRAAHPDARYELDWSDPLQLLVATILAAQCTDERVNRVTPALFARYPDAASYASADLAELEELIRSTGTYRTKARAIRDACRALVERFGGEVPPRLDALVTLPGVARKTANVVLNNAFAIPSGVIVDTHVARVSRRLGLTDEPDPERIEAELMRLLPEDDWIAFGAAMVLHGRYTCKARDPDCDRCLLDDLCPRREVGANAAPAETTRARPPKRRAVAPREDDPGDEPPMSPETLPDDWRAVLDDEFRKPYFAALREFVAGERARHKVFPPEPDVFNALKFSPYGRTKAVLLGQDPYHDDGQAHGLCFSVRPGVKPPPSLVNMFKELRDDLGCKVPNHGHLTGWAEQGLLMLNAVLTVRAHEPNSHKDRGWETFTDAVIDALNARETPVVFVLWGNYAQKKGKRIDATRHRVITGAHPSPLSAKKFFGSRPFSKVNAALAELGHEPIDWQLPDL